MAEGRSYGIGFAFLKKVEDGYQAVQPISPCKDYLNDVIYSEATGKTFYAHGLTTKKEGCFADGAYLVFQSCPFKFGEKHGDYDKEVGLLEKNLTNAQKLINDIEKLLKLEELTELVNVETNLVFAKIPKAWVSSTWAISLWSLIARNSIFSDGGDPFEELGKVKNSTEKIYINSAMARLKEFINSGLPKQVWPEGVSHDVHGNGIYYFTPEKAAK